MVLPRNKHIITSKPGEITLGSEPLVRRRSWWGRSPRSPIGSRSAFLWATQPREDGLLFKTSKRLHFLMFFLDGYLKHFLKLWSLLNVISLNENISKLLKYLIFSAAWRLCSTKYIPNGIHSLFWIRSILLVNKAPRGSSVTARVAPDPNFPNLLLPKEAKLRFQGA